MLNIKSLSANNLPPFRKGGRGGIYSGNLGQIPLNPPFAKGDFIARHYLRISSKYTPIYLNRQKESKTI
jgi:hypothetical protein